MINFCYKKKSFSLNVEERDYKEMIRGKMYQVNGYFLFSRPITKLNIVIIQIVCICFVVCVHLYFGLVITYKERLLVYLYIMLGLRYKG